MARIRWRRRPRGVRVRTTITALAAVVLVLTVSAAALVLGLRHSLRNQVEDSARLRATDVVAGLETGTAARDLAVSDDEDLVIQILGTRGSPIAASEAVTTRAALADLEPGGQADIDGILAGDDDTYLVVAERARLDDGDLLVLVGRTTDGVAESTEIVIQSLLLGLPVVALAVGAITWRVTGRALAPVEAIRHEVERISAAELGRRVPEPAADDEIGRLAATMNRMLARLEHAQERQRRFVSDASHELRSPIAVIRQHAEVALRHPESTDPSELAEVVLAEDLRVQRLVEDLLLLARADEHTLRRSTAPVDLDDLLFAEADRLGARDGVDVDVSGVSAGRVQGDRGQLSRLVRNLSDNAVRHAERHVALGLYEVVDGVCLIVDDDGDGIAADQRDRVFERFVRLDAARAREHGGTGLGLAIVREIARAHEAEVRVGDSPLGGARFEVRFPTTSV